MRMSCCSEGSDSSNTLMAVQIDRPPEVVRRASGVGNGVGIQAGVHHGSDILCSGALIFSHRSPPHPYFCKTKVK